LGSGELAPAAELEALKARVAALEAEVARPRAEAPATGEAEAEPGEAPVRSAPARNFTRGFAVPDLSARSPDHGGQMGDRSLRDLCLQLSVRRTTGLLTLRCADGRVRYGFWDKGGPVGFRTDPVQDGEVLGVLLHRANQITEAQLAQTLEIMKTRHCRQGEALMEMGVLTFPQLVQVLARQVEFVLQRVLAEPEGSWTFHDLAELPEKFLPPPLKVGNMLMRSLQGKAKDFRNEVLGEAHRPNLDRYVHVVEEMKPVLADIRFLGQEARFIEVLQSNAWRLRELFGVSPLSRQSTAVMVWCLNELGLLRYEAEQDRGRYLRQAEHLISKKKGQTQKSTYFDILEVHWICLPQEVEAAWERLRAEYDTSSWKELPLELRENLELIYRRIQEAYETLRSDHTRREYRKKVVEGFMITQSAELLGRKGEMAIMRHDRREALVCYAKAIELVPTEPSYKEGMQRSQAIPG
jgi:hypothetical protein